MKITDVKLIFAKHYLFVQVYTDEGIVGLGEAGNWGYLMATAAAIEKFKEYLIGKDPFRIEDFNQNFYRSVYFRGSVVMSAISAIDIALWISREKLSAYRFTSCLAVSREIRSVFTHLRWCGIRIRNSWRSAILT